MLSKQRKKNSISGKIIKAFQKSWSGFSNHILFWLGYNYSKKQKEIANSSNKSLTDQIIDLHFNVTKNIKIFSIIIRIFICFILYAILAADIISNVYSIGNSIVPISILSIYFITIIFILKKILNLNKHISYAYDIVYISLEIFAVYFAILTSPAHLANIYINSLKGFWFILIVLSAFTGNWYYPIFSGLLVAILNMSFLYFYNEVRVDFINHGFDINTIIPKVQVFAYSIYYTMIGFFTSFPFYLFKINQTLVTDFKINAIVAQPYHELSLVDGDIVADGYLITKITTSRDIVGADYVSFKKLNKKNGIAALVIGDTIGHGLNRSPGAIIAMAAFHSMNDFDPLKVQKSTNQVLLNIDKNYGGKTYCFSLLLKNNGLIEYSGKIEDIRIIRNKKQVAVNQAGEILGISEKLKHTKKLQLQLKVDDMLILQTDGAVYNSEEDDKTIVMITRKS